MRLQFFQRLLDQLNSRVAIINQAGTLLLVSELAQRQFALRPGAQVDVLHREGDRVMIRQPLTRQLHSALAIRWLRLEFLLFQSQPDPAVVNAPATSMSIPQRALIEFCSSPVVQSRLEPQEVQRLQRLLASETQTEPGELLSAAGLEGRMLNPITLIERAFGPALEGVDELFLQAPSTLGSVYGDEHLLVSALRALVVELVGQHRSNRLLVRLHQIDAELLITVQDIGELELPRMIRLGTDDVWTEPLMHSPDACAVIERHGGHLRMRGDVAQGRITFSFPVAVRNVFH